MFYYLYEIRNLINDNIYVGVHKTTDMDDGYMGSGKILKRAIHKYGSENFQKTILEMFDDQEQMFQREEEIVNDEFLLREDTYNLRRGGSGGFDYINKNGLANHSPEHMLAMSEKRKQLYPNGVMFGKPNHNTKPSRDEIKRLYPKSAFYGRQHTDISKQKISTVAKKNQSGSKNSQFGSKWAWVVNDQRDLKKIPLDQLEEYLSNGYQRGTKFISQP